MGWSFTHREKGITDREWFAEHVLGGSTEILACATKNNVFYAACRHTKGEGAYFKPDEVWIGHFYVVYDDVGEYWIVQDTRDDDIKGIYPDKESALERAQELDDADR